MDVVNAACNLSWGANTSIAATVLWFLTACMMCCIGFKESKGDGDDGDEYDDEPAAAPEVVDDAPPEEAVDDAAKE